MYFDVYQCEKMEHSLYPSGWEGEKMLAAVLNLHFFFGSKNNQVYLMLARNH